jgi:broad specificity phosphatase PhoE
VTKVILVPWGRTDWEEHGRLTGHIDLPVSAEGRTLVQQDAESLAGHNPGALLCGPDEAARETAELLGRRFNLKPRNTDDLYEVDLGHWAGLTDEQFRERFPKVYRQWRDEPTSVNPPGGETLEQAADRLEAGLRKALRNRRKGTIVVVTGPFAAVLLWLRQEKAPLSDFWERVEQHRRWIVIDSVRPEDAV